MAVTLDQHTVLPPAVTANEELHELQHLLDVLKLPRERRARLISPDGIEVTLPGEVHDVLLQVVQALSQGLAINVAPQNAVLTTQQAADMLNISRPTLVKLLETHQIPFTKPGRHRRVLLADLLQYQERGRARRRAMLDEMTATAEADGSADNVDGFVQTR